MLMTDPYTSTMKPHQTPPFSTAPALPQGESLLKLDNDNEGYPQGGSLLRWENDDEDRNFPPNPVMPLDIPPLIWEDRNVNPNIAYLICFLPNVMESLI